MEKYKLALAPSKKNPTSDRISIPDLMLYGASFKADMLPDMPWSTIAHVVVLDPYNL